MRSGTSIAAGEKRSVGHFLFRYILVPFLFEIGSFELFGSDRLNVCSVMFN